jgi:hypothetical protein
MFKRNYIEKVTGSLINIEHEKIFPRLSWCYGGHMIRWYAEGKIDWIFSPTMKWKMLPEEVRSFIKDINAAWNIKEKNVLRL